MLAAHMTSFHDLDLLQKAFCHIIGWQGRMLCCFSGSKMCSFLRLAELVIPQNPDGKVHMDLITQQGIQPLDIHICKNADGTDWLLGVGSYGKVSASTETPVCHQALQDQHSSYYMSVIPIVIIGPEPATMDIESATCMYVFAATCRYICCHMQMYVRICMCIWAIHMRI